MTISPDFTDLRDNNGLLPLHYGVASQAEQSTIEFLMEQRWKIRKSDVERAKDIWERLPMETKKAEVGTLLDRTLHERSDWNGGKKGGNGSSHQGEEDRGESEEEDRRANRMQSQNGAEANPEDAEIQAQFLCAVIAKQFRTVISLIDLVKNVSDLKLNDPPHHRVIHILAQNGNDPQSLRVLQRLILGLKIDIDAQNDFGDTALHIAVSGHFYHFAEVLVQSNSKMLQNVHGSSPLAIALADLQEKMGTDDFPSLLSGFIRLKFNIDSPIDFKNRTLLHFACGANKHKQCFVAEATLLIEKGANVSLIENEGLTPLHFACKLQATALFSVLLSNNDELLKDPTLPFDSSGQSPLDYLRQDLHQTFNDIFHKTQEIEYKAIRFARGPNFVPFISDKHNAAFVEKNFDFLMIATMRYQNEVGFKELLKRKDKKKKLQDINICGFTLLHSAASTNWTFPLPDLLPEIDVNSQDQFGNTPLHIAALKDSFEFIQVLIINADPSKVPKIRLNFRGHSPHDISLAVGGKAFEFIVGFSLQSLNNATDFSLYKRIIRSQLQFSKEYAVSILHSLRSYLKFDKTGEIDFNAPIGEENQSLLHIAAEKEDIKALRFLIAFGADPNQKSANGFKINFLILHFILQFGLENRKVLISLLKMGQTHRSRTKNTKMQRKFKCQMAKQHQIHLSK